MHYPLPTVRSFLILMAWHETEKAPPRCIWNGSSMENNMMGVSEQPSSLDGVLRMYCTQTRGSPNQHTRLEPRCLPRYFTTQ